MADDLQCMICLDSIGTLLRKGCACRGSSALAHAPCMANAVVSQLPHRGERAWSECQTCGQHFTGQMTIELAVVWIARCTGSCPVALERAMSFHATALQHMGAHSEAGRIFRDVLEARIARHGRAHKSTLVTMVNLASAIWHENKCDKTRTEAEMLWREVAAVRARTLGTEHPLTLESKAWLALSLSHSLSRASAQERIDEAAQLFEATIDAQTRVLGHGHAHTLITKSNHASMLVRLGDYAAAEPTFRAVIAAYRLLMGDLHPYTIMMCGNLAQCLERQHRRDEANALHYRTVQTMRDVLGPKHPDTLEYSRRGCAA